jgi:hypothetical protein
MLPQAKAAICVGSNPFCQLRENSYKSKKLPADNQ